MDLNSLALIDPKNAYEILSIRKGIYFWFYRGKCEPCYIGIAIGTGGLKRRVVSQHLNPKYLEFRASKHTEKDAYQMANSVERGSKDNNLLRSGIDKSAFRKSIGRKKSINPGSPTVEYIFNNFFLKVFESEDVDMIKKLEVDLIKKYEPEFNSSHRSRES